MCVCVCVGKQAAQNTVMALESSSFLDEMPSHDFVVCTDDEETQHRGDMNDVVYDMLDDLSVNDEGASEIGVKKTEKVDLVLNFFKQENGSLF